MEKLLFDRNVNLALSAAAGTGKTRILSLRFLDLYLKYQNLSSIYALTFTNKASQEMKERIVHCLNILYDPKKSTIPSTKNSAGRPSTKDSAVKEQQEIVRIFGTRFKDINKKAKRSRRQLISNFADLNISTIHSFLNSILKTIPFQTNVLPDFRIIEEGEEDILMDTALDDFLIDALNNKNYKILLDSIIKQKHRDLKSDMKGLLSSLLPRILEIKEIFALNRHYSEAEPENLRAAEEATKNNFISFKLSSLKLVKLLKNNPHHNKTFKKKVGKIEEFFKHNAREESTAEMMDLFQT